MRHICACGNFEVLYFHNAEILVFKSRPDSQNSLAALSSLIIILSYHDYKDIAVASLSFGFNVFLYAHYSRFVFFSFSDKL